MNVFDDFTMNSPLFLDTGLLEMFKKEKRRSTSLFVLLLNFAAAKYVPNTLGQKKKSLICKLLTRHHNSQSSSCITRQQPQRSGILPAAPSSPLLHINLSVCALGHPLTILIPVFPIYWKTGLSHDGALENTAAHLKESSAARRSIEDRSEPAGDCSVGLFDGGLKKSMFFFPPSVRFHCGIVLRHRAPVDILSPLRDTTSSHSIHSD